MSRLILDIAAMIRKSNAIFWIFWIFKLLIKWDRFLFSDIFWTTNPPIIHNGKTGKLLTRTATSSEKNNEVKDKIYPGPEHTVFMSDEELKKFAKDMKWEKKLAQLD